eukprot:XP_001706091.1 Hypothetical protein GL50803_36068 [Giardia lamblia ATCC 50803]
MEPLLYLARCVGPAEGLRGTLLDSEEGELSSRDVLLQAALGELFDLVRRTVEEHVNRHLLGHLLGQLEEIAAGCLALSDYKQVQLSVLLRCFHGFQEGLWSPMVPERLLHVIEDKRAKSLRLPCAVIVEHTILLSVYHLYRGKALNVELPTEILPPVALIGAVNHVKVHNTIQLCPGLSVLWLQILAVSTPRGIEDNRHGGAGIAQRVEFIFA